MNNIIFNLILFIYLSIYLYIYQDNRKRKNQKLMNYFIIKGFRTIVFIFIVISTNDNKDEDNCPKTLNDKNHQTKSQKFR